MSNSLNICFIWGRVIGRPMAFTPGMGTSLRIRGARCKLPLQELNGGEPNTFCEFCESHFARIIFIKKVENPFYGTLVTLDMALNTVAHLQGHPP